METRIPCIVSFRISPDEYTALIVLASAKGMTRLEDYLMYCAGVRPAPEGDSPWVPLTPTA